MILRAADDTPRGAITPDVFAAFTMRQLDIDTTCRWLFRVITLFAMPPVSYAYYATPPITLLRCFIAAAFRLSRRLPLLFRFSRYYFRHVSPCHAYFFAEMFYITFLS